MTANPEDNKRTARVTVVALVALFALPLVIAWFMYSDQFGYKPQETVNRGNLLEPPVRGAIPSEFGHLGIEEHWVLLYPLPRDCDDRCLSRLLDLRKVQRSLGKGGDRLKVVLLTRMAPDKELSQHLDAIYPEFPRVVDHAGKLSTQLERIGGGHGTYILDPLGNIMMHYVPESTPDDMRTDLERLLRYAATDIRQ